MNNPIVSAKSRILKKKSKNISLFHVKTLEEILDRISSVSAFICPQDLTRYCVLKIFLFHDKQKEYENIIILI